jgi:hypothetical protein
LGGMCLTNFVYSSGAGVYPAVGGAGFLGGAGGNGVYGAAPSSVPTAATGYGNGGGGAAYTTGNVAGATGSAGIVVVEW